MDVSCQLLVPVALPPGKNTGTHRIGGWVEPSAGLDVSENITISYSHRQLNIGKFSPYSSKHTGKLMYVSVCVTVFLSQCAVTVNTAVDIHLLLLFWRIGTFYTRCCIFCHVVSKTYLINSIFHIKICLSQACTNERNIVVSTSISFRICENFISQSTDSPFRI
jgi:hypothetical protein